MTQRLNSFSVDELCSLWKSEHFAYDRESAAASLGYEPFENFPPEQISWNFVSFRSSMRNFEMARS